MDPLPLAADNRVTPLDSRDPWDAPPRGRFGIPLIVADGVVAIIRREGGDLKLSGGYLHIREVNGPWRIATRADVQRLRCLVQEGVEALGQGGRLSVLAASWRRLTEHPGLLVREVAPADEPAVPVQDWSPPVKPQLSRARQTVLAAINATSRTVSPTDIAKVCGMRPVNVRYLVGELFRDGALKRVGFGQYRRLSESVSARDNDGPAHTWEQGVSRNAAGAQQKVA